MPNKRNYVFYVCIICKEEWLSSTMGSADELLFVIPRSHNEMIRVLV